MIDDPDRLERELAVVRQLNGTRLDELEVAVAEHRRETAALLDEVDAIVGMEPRETLDASTPSSDLRQPLRSQGRPSQEPDATWGDLVRTADSELAAQGIVPVDSLGALLSPEEDARVLQHL